MKGHVAVIPILELGKILQTLEGHDKFDAIVEKIKKDTEIDLARLAAFYVKQGLDVVIEPHVQVADRVKVPDLKVTFGETPVFFEAYSPNASKKFFNIIHSRRNDG